MRSNSEILKRHKLRNIILNLTFSSIIFFTFIGALEVLLRTTHLFGARISWSKPDTILGYRFTPGSRYWFNKENDHPITGRINNYGYRDREWSLRKPRNTYRIAVLGDSYVEALQVESDRTFLALTENQLNKNNRGTKVELMNFGRSDFTQTEELLVLKNDVVQFFPDMVLLFFYPGNDIRDVSRETAPNLVRPFYHVSENGELILDTSFTEMGQFKIRYFINWFQQHSALISLICNRYSLRLKQARFKNMSKAKGTNRLPNKIEDYLNLCTANPDPIYSRNYRLNKILIEAMSTYCSEKGIRFMLVTLDNEAYIPKVEKRYKAIDSTFDPFFFEDDLKSYSRLLGIEQIGLQRIFRRFYKNTGIPLHWGSGHWNYQGHKTVANVLSNKLKLIIYSNEQRG